MRCRYYLMLVVLLADSVTAEQRPRASEVEEFAAKIAWQQAQEPPAFRKTRQAFLAAWSGDDPEALDEIISPDFDGRDKTIGFLGFVKADHGPVRKLQFKYFDTLMQRQNPRRLAVYHAVLDDGSEWAFRLGLDSDGRIDRLIMTDPNYNEILPVQRSSQQFELPFVAGEQWYVLWGGRTESSNYHVRSRAQRYALDLLVLHPYSKQSYKGDGTANSDYYAYARAVTAPIDGTVVAVIDGIDDNIPGQTNPSHLTGNTVVIAVRNDEYLLLAHLQKGSIPVQVGDTVTTGDRIGKVGNSGNSSEPHLHMQLMSTPDIKSATGIEIRFRELIVREHAHVRNYSPIRTDTIEKAPSMALDKQIHAQ